MVNKYSLAVNEITDALSKLDIDLFIANSFGAALLLDSLNNFNDSYKNKKMILISPMINFNIKPNQNKNNDILNYYLLKKIINIFIDRTIQINFTNLPESLIICSTNEIFYNDIINFYNKLKKVNKTDLLILDNCIHSDIVVYGLFNKKSTIYTTNIIISKLLNNDNYNLQNTNKLN
jgi:hypothetical protein